MNFLTNGPNKSTFGIFEILKIEMSTNFLFVFVNIGPNGSEISKRYSSYKQQPKVFSLIFLSMILTKLRWGFFKFWI